MPVRISSAYLPEAGKPAGLCPECGPHGNRGAVTLLYSVVPCITCDARATDAGIEHALGLLRELSEDLRKQGARNLLPEYAVDPVDGQPWARRVTARVEYQHAPTEAPPEWYNAAFNQAVKRLGVP